MSRVAYVDGQYLPHRSATVPIEDRGYSIRRRCLRGDGDGRRIPPLRGASSDAACRSLAELQIPAPMSNAALRIVMREVIPRNDVRDGILYVQITRGVAARDHASPRAAGPVLVVTSRRKKPIDPQLSNAASP